MSTNPSAFGNSPTGVAGGSLTGTYPNPVISQAQAVPWLPSDAGFLAWNFDPGLCTLTAVAPSAGQVSIYRVNVRSAITVTNVTILISVGGGTLTAGENFAGLYNSSGTLVGTTADETTNWGAAFTTPMPLTGGPFALTAGFYWVAVMSNGTTGPTLLSASPTFRSTNAGLAVSGARAATNGTGTTSLPASITPGSNVIASPLPFVALS